jgi:hypothetical protein
MWIECWLCGARTRSTLCQMPATYRIWLNKITDKADTLLSARSALESLTFPRKRKVDQCGQCVAGSQSIAKWAETPSLCAHGGRCDTVVRGKLCSLTGLGEDGWFSEAALTGAPNERKTLCVFGRRTAAGHNIVGPPRQYRPCTARVQVLP